MHRSSSGFSISTSVVGFLHSKAAEGLGPGTLRNVYLTFSPFFHWAVGEFAIENPMDRIQVPRFPPKPVEPLTRDEVQAMVRACDMTQAAATTRRKSFHMRRRTGSRDLRRGRSPLRPVVSRCGDWVRPRAGGRIYFGGSCPSV